MSFRSVFLAVVIAFALILAAFLVNRARPNVETDQPTADFVRASGKCAECHARLQYSVVHEYEMSAHAKKGVNCLDCHQPGPRQQKVDHHGFVISAHLTAGNCRSCHEGHLSGIPPQPPRGAELGRRPWRKGLESRAGCLQRTVSARRHETSAQSADVAGGASCHHIGMRAVPCYRQAE